MFLFYTDFGSLYSVPFLGKSHSIQLCQHHGNCCGRSSLSSRSLGGTTDFIWFTVSHGGQSQPLPGTGQKADPTPCHEAFPSPSLMQFPKTDLHRLPKEFGERIEKRSFFILLIYMRCLNYQLLKISRWFAFLELNRMLVFMSIIQFAEQSNFPTKYWYIYIKKSINDAFSTPNMYLALG